MTKQLDIEGPPIYVPVRMSMKMKDEITQRSKAWNFSINLTVVELIQKGLDHTP